VSVDAMTRLAAANPVLDPPAVESPERLRCLIEDDASAVDLGERRSGSSMTDKGRWLGRRALVAVAVCVAASVVGVVLSSGSSGPGVNVAAAAYAATSPGAGLVEAVFMTRVLRGSQAGGTLLQREWNDAAAGLRRERDSTTGPYGDTHETHVLEIVDAPGRLEMWSAGREASTVTRITKPGETKLGIAFGGISLAGVEGIKLYRKVYREGLIRLVGRARYDGRLLWKLETPRGRVDPVGSQVSHTSLVVLVDPKSFLPVSVRQKDLELPGHPVVVESNLVSYRHAEGGEREGKLFDLAAQHPGARIHTSAVDTARSLRRYEHRRTDKRR
jgi:hypothetical protein